MPSIHPPSPGETKLLAKTVALAQLLSNRHLTLFSGSLHHTAVRRRFLLAALLQVTRALDAVPKAIGATDRFLDLLELLSHFHFPQALQLLQDGRWTARVQSKLRQARLKKCLAQWRLMARSSASAKRILRGDVGRERLLPKAILRPVAALEEEPSLKLFFRKWGLAYRLKRVTACNSVDLAVRVMPKWRKCTLLKQVYEHYMGHGTFTSVIDIAVQPSASCGPRVLAAYAFKSWRGLSKLQRRRIDDFIHDKRSAFDGWRRRTEKRVNHYKIASLYDCTRNLRPALSIWHGLCQKTRHGRDAAIKFNLARLLGKSMELWREKRTKLTRLNRFLGRWRGALEFKARCQATAHEYLQRKLIVNKLLQWRQRVVIVTTLQASADRLIKKKSKDQAEIYFNVWHKMKTWINRSSEKMRTIRAARLAKNALNHWRMQLQTKQAAESLYRVGLVKKCWAAWTLKLWEAQEATSTKSRVLENWRRIVAIRNAIKAYFKHRGVNNPCIEAHPWPDACVRLRAQSIFTVLRRRALLRRQLDFYTHKKNVSLQADIFKGWRLDANVVFYLKQKPWRSKRRILRKLRVLFGHKHEEHSKLHVALDEHLRGKQYVAFYRGFERWQQAFQSRKMEEHLCDQNVQYYYRRKRLLVLQNWQLLTALRILQRVKALNGKKQLFQAWKGSASFITGSRRGRLVSRFMARWRQNYREAVANQLVRETSRKLTRLTFISWRTHSQRQRDSHSRSIEFIGNSSLHYYLQRWRTETTAKRCNQNLAKGGKIGWVQMLKTSPRYQNYSRVPGRRATLTLSREEPLLELTPLVDAEFMKQAGILNSSRPIPSNHQFSAMEKRDKKARLQSLTELRRLRIEGGSRIEALKKETDQDTEYYNDVLGPEMHDEDDDDQEREDAFIEQDRQAKRPAAFAFKPRRPTAASKESRLDQASLTKDDFFQSLISKMDQDLGSDDEEEQDNPHTAATALPDRSPLVAPSHDPLLQSASLGTAGLPMSEGGILSSEWAPSEGQFEIDDATLDQMAVDWSDGISLDDDGSLSPAMQCDVETFKENVPPPAATFIEAVQVDAVLEEEPSSRDRAVAVGDAIDFYWIDAFERPNGTIFLFGKVRQGGSTVSCCVTINAIKRNVFFLPRETHMISGEPVTLKDVYQEVSDLATAHRISKFGCKKVLRRYAFEVPGIPVEADYIKMVYGFAEGPMLPKDLTGKTFSHVFGTNSSALELFLVKRKIMGPCWLRIVPSGTLKRNVSWCKVEVEVDNPKTVMPIVNGPEAPPLTVLSLAMRTVIEPTSKTHELVAVSGLVYQRVHADGHSTNGAAERPRCNAVFAVARDLENLGFSAKFTDQFHRALGAGTGKVELAKNERALLSYLLTMIYRADPDVIVGHNFLGFDLGVLLHRMRACKVDFWSRLGRLNWSQWPKAKPGSTEASYAERQIVAGRLICDTYLSAKDLVKSKNYQLQTLVEVQLQQERHPFDYARVEEHVGTAEGLAFLLRHCEKDAYFQAALMFQLMVLPLTKQLTSIAGNLWSRTLMGARAERNEYLLLHEFHAQKYLCPDKTSAQEHMRALAPVEEGAEDDIATTTTASTVKGGRRKPTYAGGLVLEPKKGLYENYVLLLDFNSLYPSIIQEFNICFTTIERDYSTPESAERMPPVPEPNTPPGLLPRILGSLVARRKQIKTLMKDPKATPATLAQLHIRQQALKLTANSMYGCLGFAHSRFFARPLAMLITGKGREILQSTVDLAQSVCHLEVLYGDTDSVMIHTGTRDLGEARKMGQLLKRTVNERYRLLEIELDGIFERLLLLKKKKYAAVVIEEHVDGSLHRRRETKGLDLVRRDWCALSVDTSNQVLEQILPMEPSSVSADSLVAARVHEILHRVAEQVATNAIPLEQYIISKNLTKEPEQYHDAKNQPHVVVALQMKAKGQAVRAGDTIPYVVCAAGKSMLSENAFHPDDVGREGSALQVDTEWYLTQQVHPCVARLCEHLVGTDAGKIAAALGLDSSKYRSGNPQATHKTMDQQAQLTRFLSDEEKYRDVDRFHLQCPTCGDEREFTGFFRLAPNGQLVSGLECQGPDEHHPRHLIPLSVLHYQLMAAIRHQIAEYYQGWLVCDETMCQARTRQPRVYEGRCVLEGCRGSLRPLRPGAILYRQLLYYLYLVDVDRLRLRLGDTATVTMGSTVNWRAVAAECETVKGMVKKHVDKCAYPIINLAEIFSFCSVTKHS